MIAISHHYNAYGHRYGAAGQSRNGYAGELFETTAGFHLLGSRSYDPTLRRFLSPDLMSPFEAGGVNRYAYGGNDPINRVDPTGTAWWRWLVDGMDRLASIATALRRMLIATTPPMQASAIASLPIQGGYVRRPLGSGKGQRILNDIASGAQAPDSPVVVKTSPEGRDLFQVDDTNTFQIMPQWHERRLSLGDGAGATHWVADSAINYDHVATPLRSISRLEESRGNGPVYIYVGVHGSVQGDNWISGVRQSPHEFTLKDDADMRAEASKLGVGSRVRIENIANLHEVAMVKAMRRTGNHVHGYCYSAVDELFLRTLNIPPVPVYDFSF